MRLELLSAITADATGSTMYFRGGKCYFISNSGDFGGGTVALQYNAFGSTWVTMASDTVSSVEALDLPSGDYRAVLSGSTTPTALTAILTSAK